MVKEAQNWLNNWKEIETKYTKMHYFKFSFFYGKLNYYYNKPDKKQLIYQLQAINEALVTHKEKLAWFFRDLIFTNFNYSVEQYIFNTFLTFAHNFIEDLQNFWKLFNKIYDQKTIFKDYQIEIDSKIFETINFLRKCLDHATSIKIYPTNKNLIENSHYLKCEGNINNVDKLYLNQIHISLGKSLDSLISKFIHAGESTGILFFNEYKYKILFNTQQIIDTFLLVINKYLNDCIKIERILNKNKTKYLKIFKIITNNPKRENTNPFKNKVYDFNHKDNPFYNPNLKNNWTLTIERKEKQISKQIKLRKEFILTYQETNEKPKKRIYGIKARHKGCAIGKLMDNLLDDNDKITLKNLKKINSYTIGQPDGLLISIYLIIKITDEKHIIKNYLSKTWFSCIGIETVGRDLMELEFPWGFIETEMPFDERIGNMQYRAHIYLSSYYE